MNKQTRKHWLAAALILLALGIVGSFDAEEEQRQAEEYCEMVKAWNEDRARGVPEHDRAGWPPFEGEEQCRVH